MIRRVTALVLGAALVATSGCGARTGFDELGLGPGAGGSSGAGISGAGSSGITPSCAGTGGGPVVLYSGPALPSSGPQGPGALVVDSTSVYWTAPATTEGAGGSVMTAPLCGGTATTLASATAPSTQVNLEALAVGGSSVYWVLHDDATGSPGDQVMQVPTGGGASTAVTKHQHPAALTVDANNVYWPDDTSETVWTVPFAGGVPRQLGMSFWGAGTEVLGSVAVDGTGVYFWSSTQGLVSLPLNGGQGTMTTPLLPMPEEVFSLGVSGGNLYWANGLEQNASIQTMPVGGGAPTTLVSASPSEFIGNIAVDGASVYWLGAQCTGGGFGTCTGNVMKVPVGGGAVTTVASGWQANGAGGSIVVDGASVYWTVANSVMRMTPK